MKKYVLLIDYLDSTETYVEKRITIGEYPYIICKIKMHKIFKHNNNDITPIRVLINER